MEASRESVRLVGDDEDVRAVAREEMPPGVELGDGPQWRRQPGLSRRPEVGQGGADVVVEVPHYAAKKVPGGQKSRSLSATQGFEILCLSILEKSKIEQH